VDYFYQPDIIFDAFHLDEVESRHCAKVLRKKVEDQILVLDGKGQIYTCRIKKIHPKQVEFEIINKRIMEKSSYSVHLVIAPTKNADRIEWLIEKSIEIGLHQISFIECHNSERHRLNMARMRKKAISAMKQCQNPFLPIINELIPIKEYLDTADENSEKYICHASGGKGNYLINAAYRDASYQVLIGPEGDFTEEESSLARKKGFIPVSLGNSRLRTETAGLVACAILNALNLKT
jgi:16S rRNA (uracil1498-N3)-methyltransferase